MYIYRFYDELVLYQTGFGVKVDGPHETCFNVSPCVRPPNVGDEGCVAFCKRQNFEHGYCKGNVGSICCCYPKK